MVLKKSTQPDYVLLGLIAVLVAWGIFMVGTISFPFSLERFGHPWYYLLHQLAMLSVGIVLAILCFKIPLETLKKWAPRLFFANLVLASLVLLPRVGLKLGGAQRWLDLGKFLFQPSEFLKLSFILYLATWLSARQETQKKKKLRHLLLPFGIILAILIILLQQQRDLSTLAIIFLIGTAMYFTAATPLWHTFLIIGAGLGGAILMIIKEPYRLDRLRAFFNPDIEPLGISYQLKQALLAIGSGRLLGLGRGFSLGLKSGSVPHPMTDSIFAIIGERFGFIGSCLLILVFLLFAWRGLKLATRFKEGIEGLLASGIVVWFISQAFFNIAGIIGIIPMGGVPLPFFSYGGSHLIAEMLAVGILLNISKKT